MTDGNGLIYMRARYYSPDMRRFVNADIVAGAISEAVTLNRFAYANGNPVSNIDPFGLRSLKDTWNSFTNWVSDTTTDVKNWAVDTYNESTDWINENIVDPIKKFVNDAQLDIQNFDWDNTSEQAVLESQYFSAYKGKLVIRMGGVDHRSGSFGPVLFIDHVVDNRSDRIQTVQHEYGHTKQFDELGLKDYLLYVLIPSFCEWGPEEYYLKPWEITADIYGGVDIYNRPNSPVPTHENISNGYEYMRFIDKDYHSMFTKFLYIAHLRHLDDWWTSFFDSSATAKREK